MNVPETTVQTLYNDVLWGKDNGFELDTYLTFPHRVVYDQNNMVPNSLKSCWNFYGRIYTMTENQYTNGVAPFLNWVNFRQKISLYFKDLD